MSKRFGDVAVADFHKKGYLAEALINFVALLGWNPGTDKEIFSLSQLEKEFSIEKTQKGGAIFSTERLDFINGLYIRQKSIEKLTDLCRPYLGGAGDSVTNSQLQKIIEVSRSRMKKLSDIVELSDFFFVDELGYDKTMLKWDNMQEGDIKDALLLCDKLLSEEGGQNIKDLESKVFSAIVEFNKQKGYPEKNKGFVLWPLRVALSGKQFSPSPFEIIDILGIEKSLKRIKLAIDKL
jgi:glutamyl/glutaminyl-tRNA synthetase